MLEQGLRLVIPGLVTTGHAEWESFAAATLLARMADSSLEPAPVWCGDLADMDPFPFLGVDLITAGFPCPPFSGAGKRQGTDDDRWIWPDIARLVREVGPRYVFIENVPGLLVGPKDQLAGIGHVLRDLAALGFDAEWLRLGADDAGAPHERQRVFILAYANGQQPERDRGPGLVGSETATEPRQACQRERTGNAVGRGCASVADTGIEGQPRWSDPVGDIGNRTDGGRSQSASVVGASRDSSVADTSSLGDRAEIDGGKVGRSHASGPTGRSSGSSGGMADSPRERRGEAGRYLCGQTLGPCGCIETMADAASLRERESHDEERTDTRRDTRRDTGGSLRAMADPDPDRARRQVDRTEPDDGPTTLTHSGRVSDVFPPGRDDNDRWLRVLADGCPEPSFRRVADGVAGKVAERVRLAELHLIGNGVCPQTVAMAAVILAHRAGVAEALGIRVVDTRNGW